MNTEGQPTLELEGTVRRAVRAFWATRSRQAKRQGGRSGVKDAGQRGAVTGGAQMDGFIRIPRGLLIRCGFLAKAIFNSKSLELPGWYRSQKQWDLLLVKDGNLVGAMELKSQIGSLGNNFNNRAEEVIGLGTDTLAAFRQGLFDVSPRPWVGYLMLLEDTPRSTKAVGVKQPHFPVCEEFNGSSYVQRYSILLRKLVHDGLFDAACLIAANPERARSGDYRQPSPELTFERFARSLVGRASSEVVLLS